MRHLRDFRSPAIFEFFNTISQMQSPAKQRQAIYFMMRSKSQPEAYLAHARQKPEINERIAMEIFRDWQTMALPRGEAEVSDFNGIRKNLGSNCLIAFQSVSERLPKRALPGDEAELRRQYCKLTGDGC